MGDWRHPRPPLHLQAGGDRQVAGLVRGGVQEARDGAARHHGQPEIAQWDV